jgi:hypothetical protein
MTLPDRRPGESRDPWTAARSDSSEWLPSGGFDAIGDAFFIALTASMGPGFRRDDVTHAA